MTKILLFSAQKGGTGKTTIATMFLHGLANRGKRVLGIDLDGQANFTDTMNASTEEPTLYDVIAGKASLIDAIQETSNDNINFIGSSADVYNMASLLTTIASRYREKGNEAKAPYIIKDALAPLISDNSPLDYIIIDTPPEMSATTLNAIYSADDIFIIAKADKFSFVGTERLIDQIAEIGLTNHINGVIINGYDNRVSISKIARDAMRKLTTDKGVYLYEQTIRRSAKVDECNATKTCILNVAKGTGVCRDVWALLDEYQSKQ